METNFDIVFNQLIHSLGWSFFHSIWQAILIAVILLIAVSLKPKLKAASKYRLFTGGLVLFLLCNVVTFFYYFNGLSTPAESGLITYGSWAQVSTQIQEAQLMQRFLQGFQENITTIVFLWGTGFVLFSLRIFGGLIYIKSIKDRATEWTETHLTDKLDHFKSQLALTKPVKLLLSKSIHVPMTVGFLKPVILFPVALINQISTEELEAILAHELAHIKRYDFLINLMVSFIESIYYYHPAVWWMSNQIRQERENCCDDMAMQLCEDKLSYAKSLMKAQEFQMNTVPILAIGFSKNNQRLLDRIKRILEVPNQKSKLMEKIAATTLFLLLITVFAFSTENRGVEKSLENHELHLLTKKDTTPIKYSRTIQAEMHGSSINFKSENNEAVELMIDGKVIAPSEFKNHQDLINEMLLWEPPKPKSKIHQSKSKPSQKNKKEGNGFGFVVPPASIEIEELNDLLEENGFPNFHNSLENFNFPEIPAMPEFPVSGLQSFSFEFDNNEALPELFEDLSNFADPSPFIFRMDDTSKTEKRIIIKGSKEGEPVEIIINDDKVIINGDEYMDVERKVEVIDGEEGGRSFMLRQSESGFPQWERIELSEELEREGEEKMNEALKLYERSIKEAEKKMHEAHKKMELQHKQLDKEKEKLHLKMDKQKEVYKRNREALIEQMEMKKKHKDGYEYSYSRGFKKALEADPKRVDSLMHMSHDMIALMNKNNDAFSKAFDTNVFYFDGIDKGNYFDDVLIDNGLIKPGQFYSMKLTNKKLKINGKTVPDAVKKEIEKIYKEKYNATLGRKSQFQLKTQARKN